MTARPELTLFVSDLHLDDSRPGVSQAFFDFLEHIAAHAQALYILGDFFNVWIGDDQPGELSRAVSAALARLAARDTAVYLMHGNRDFLLGPNFAQASEARLIQEPYILNGYGRRYLLLHGDTLCTGDTDYMQFRQMVRNSHWQREFLARPLAERQQFAQQARAQSKAMNSNKPEDIMDVHPREVAHVMRENQVHTLIHGHTHRPGIHDFDLDGQPAQRIVLGDWDRQGWYLQLSEHGHELKNFSI